MNHRIIFVDHTPFAGGGQLVLVEHIRELTALGWQVHVACTDAVPSLVEHYRQSGATVHLLEMPRLRGLSWKALKDFLATAGQLKSLIQAEEIDVVVANTTRASYLTSLAMFGQRRVHLWWVRDYLYPKFLFRLLKHKVDRIIFVSKSVQEWYLSPQDSKGVVLYVASNLYQELEQVSQDRVDTERSYYGLAPDHVVVGFMGRLVEEKGPQDVIVAAARLFDAYPNLHVLVVGSGSNQENNIESALHEEVMHLGLSDRVHFAGFQTDQALYYKMMDIFVLPTRNREPFATSMVQAMMAGLPVIGTNAGGTPELVVERQTGLLYPPGDIGGLANAIKLLLDDSALRQTVAQQGQQRVLQFHREDQLAGQADQLYRSLLPAAKSSS